MFCPKTKVFTVCILMSLVLSPHSWAQQQTAAEQVKQINEEIAVLNARLQKLDTEAKIAAKEAEKSRASGSLSVSTAFDSAKTSAELPVIRGIEGMDGKLAARLVTRGGLEQTVREGDKIGGLTIKSITVNAVVIARGSETTTLAFGSEPPAEVRNTNQSSVMPIPFPPAATPTR